MATPFLMQFPQTINNNGKKSKVTLMHSFHLYVTLHGIHMCVYSESVYCMHVTKYQQQFARICAGINKNNNNNNGNTSATKQENF